MLENNFAADLEFLKQHVETMVLENGEGAQLVVVPAYQGRTMTSTSSGPGGTSYGYLNYDAIASQQRDSQINLYGGEDRMWVSPEGGQYSVFFDPGVPMEYANWRTPAVLDTEPFQVVEQDDRSISFSKRAALTNWSRFEFQIQMDRRVVLLDRNAARGHLGHDLDGLSISAHESHNTLTNAGESSWQPATGLIGIWMLCMNKPSPAATLLVPFKPGPTEQLGPCVNADYFGKLDSNRLIVDEPGGMIFFLGDGNLRSKLGLTFQRAQPWIGSWDQQRGVLSVVQFNLPADAPAGYNNNLWEFQEHPYEGDVINAYNDGPNESGGQLGGFFELETISPALALSPQQSYTHIHRTIRMEGDRDALSSVAEKSFGVSLAGIESKFG